MNIRNVFFALPIVLIAACSNTNSSSAGFELKGKLGNAHGDTLFLELMSTDGLKNIDTVILDANGEFVMHPVISEIGFYRLKTSKKNFATFIFDENQKVSVTGDVADLGN